MPDDEILIPEESTATPADEAEDADALALYRENDDVARHITLGNLAAAKSKPFAIVGGRQITRTDADDTFSDGGGGQPASIPAALLNFAPKAPKTGRLVDKITEQHATAIHIDPDDDLGAYYSYRGDLAAFSAANQDGYIASAGVQEVGTEVIGLTNPAPPANANTATNDFLLCHEAITINSNAAHGLLAILHTTSGNNDYFKNLFRVHNRILQFNTSAAASYLVADDVWQNVNQAATGTALTLQDGTAHFAYSINKSGNADIGLEVNVVARQGDTIKQGERSDASGGFISIPGGTWDFSKIARTNDASIFDIANKRGYTSHASEGTLARHIDNNLLRLFGKIRISLVNTDKIGVMGTWDFAKLMAGGNQVIGSQWRWAKVTIGRLGSFDLGEDTRGKIAAVLWTDNTKSMGVLTPGSNTHVASPDITALPVASANRVLQNGDQAGSTNDYRAADQNGYSAISYTNTEDDHQINRVAGTIKSLSVLVLDEAPA